MHEHRLKDLTVLAKRVVSITKAYKNRNLKLKHMPILMRAQNLIIDTTWNHKDLNLPKKTKRPNLQMTIIIM